MPSGAFEPPPTYAEPVVVDERTGKSLFNPLWLKWFLDLAGILSASGGGSGGILHNNLTGLQGGQANEYYHLKSSEYTALSGATSGSYTPTLTNTTNLAASTAYACYYQRVGSVVLVAGRVDVDPTAAGQCVLGLTVPIASNFTTANQLGGTAASPTVAGQSAAIYSDAANDRATMEWVAVDTANRAMYFTFAYGVI